MRLLNQRRIWAPSGEITSGALEDFASHIVYWRWPCKLVEAHRRGNAGDNEWLLKDQTAIQ